MRDVDECLHYPRYLTNHLLLPIDQPPFNKTLESRARLRYHSDSLPSPWIFLFCTCYYPYTLSERLHYPRHLIDRLLLRQCCRLTNPHSTKPSIKSLSKTEILFRFAPSPLVDIYLLHPLPLILSQLLHYSWYLINHLLLPISNQPAFTKHFNQSFKIYLQKIVFLFLYLI
jgi:hypothetical protein